MIHPFLVSSKYGVVTGASSSYSPFSQFHIVTLC
jgi:hypothetical protein